MRQHDSMRASMSCWLFAAIVCRKWARLVAAGFGRREAAAVQFESAVLGDLAQSEL